MGFDNVICECGKLLNFIVTTGMLLQFKCDNRISVFLMNILELSYILFIIELHARILTLFIIHREIN